MRVCLDQKSLFCRHATPTIERLKILFTNLLSSNVRILRVCVPARVYACEFACVLVLVCACDKKRRSGTLMKTRPKGQQKTDRMVSGRSRPSTTSRGVLLASSCSRTSHREYEGGPTVQDCFETKGFSGIFGLFFDCLPADVQKNREASSCP